MLSSFRTSDQGYFTMDKVLMEAAVCVSGAVGSDQELWPRRNTVHGSELI